MGLVQGSGHLRQRKPRNGHRPRFHQCRVRQDAHYQLPNSGLPAEGVIFSGSGSRFANISDTAGFVSTLPYLPSMPVSERLLNMWDVAGLSRSTDFVRVAQLLGSNSLTSFPTSRHDIQFHRVRPAGALCRTYCRSLRHRFRPQRDCLQRHAFRVPQRLHIRKSQS